MLRAPLRLDAGAIQLYDSSVAFDGQVVFANNTSTGEAGDAKWHLWQKQQGSWRLQMAYSVEGIACRAHVDDGMCRDS